MAVTSATVHLKGQIPLKWGGAIREAEIAYQLSGPEGAPLVLVLGGISAGRRVVSPDGNEPPGWWEIAVGEGKPIDTSRYRVLTFDYVSGRGDSKVLDSDRYTSIDTCDQAAVAAAFISELGLGPLRAVIGASYGGMIALALAAEHAELAGHAIVFGAAHESHPMATGLRSIQRNIVRLGMAGQNASDGVRIARALAITTYRSAAEFVHRFRGAPERNAEGFHFPVESYLDHQGEKFAAAFDAQMFLTLSESCDLHLVSPQEITVPVTLVAVDSDTLVPLWQMRELASALPNCRALHEFESIYGHDAFLKEESVTAAIGRALDGEG